MTDDVRKQLRRELVKTASHDDDQLKKTLSTKKNNRENEDMLYFPEKKEELRSLLHLGMRLTLGVVAVSFSGPCCGGTVQVYLGTC